MLIGLLSKRHKAGKMQEKRLSQLPLFAQQKKGGGEDVHPRPLPPTIKIYTLAFGVFDCRYILRVFTMKLGLNIPICLLYNEKFRSLSSR